jgi:phosphoribosylglycinamide formyltransferase 1
VGVKVPIRENYQLLYSPSEGKVLNVVVFGSGSGTNLLALLEAQKQSKKFNIQAIVCDKKCRCCEIAESENIPLIYLSFLKFIRNHGVEKSTLSLRMQYEEEIIQALQQLSQSHNFSIDIIFLAGYMRIVTSTLLNHFPNKILNVHPADLTVTDAKGHRQYIGAHAVYESLLAGENQTRSCVIIVDNGVDTGPIIASGPFIDYTDELPVTKESAQRHQEKQKQQSDWPIAIKSLELISDGLVGIDDNATIYIHDIPQKMGGYHITKSLPSRRL